jgi:deferrochelatase/peroxidase EfeB
VVNATTQDDPELGADASRNNDFKFQARDQSACPFASHIRKMNPRGDLSESAITPHMILRRGIPFGPEVSDEEKQSQKTSQERGLLFVCYQSSLSNGFSFLQQGELPLINDWNYANLNTSLVESTELSVW